MADYGVRIFGDAGNPQVDNMGAISMGFLGKGSVTLSEQLSAITAPVFSRAWVAPGSAVVTVSGARLYAFRARYGDRPVGVMEEQGGESRSVRFVGAGNNDGTFPIVDWWAFGRPPANAETYGVQAWNDNGLMSWSSAYRPMKIEAFTNDAPVSAVDAGRAGDWAVCVGRPLGGVRSGSETSVSGQWRWLESRVMWGYPSSTGFASPSRNVVMQREGNNYPTGWRETDIKASILLVDVAGL